MEIGPVVGLIGVNKKTARVIGPFCKWCSIVWLIVLPDALS